MYKLYFIINGKRNEVGKFPTLEQAEKRMLLFIVAKHRKKVSSIRKRQIDHHIFYDYGVPNEEYIVEVTKTGYEEIIGNIYEHKHLLEEVNYE